LISPGDLVIVINYALVPAEHASSFQPAVVFVDEHNRVLSRGGDPAEVPEGSGLMRSDEVAVGGMVS
jgi:aspartate 1-decarboxylase